jgi:hypothetical protein
MGTPHSMTASQWSIAVHRINCGARDSPLCAHSKLLDPSGAVVAIPAFATPDPASHALSNHIAEASMHMGADSASDGFHLVHQ